MMLINESPLGKNEMIELHIKYVRSKDLLAALYLYFYEYIPQHLKTDNERYLAENVHSIEDFSNGQRKQLLKAIDAGAAHLMQLEAFGKQTKF